MIIWPIVGGILIGLSAVILLLSLGRIAGISGIIWGALPKISISGDRAWRLQFLLALMAGTFLWHLLSGQAIPTVEHAPLKAVVAGLLVGMGVKIGQGCTSGHGVCGLSRFSLRSLCATLLFMFTAIITVAFTR